MQNYILTLTKYYTKSYSGLSSTIWYGLSLHAIISILIGVFYFLAIYFVQELHFNIASASIIVSCYGIGAMMGGYLGGKLSDHFNPKFISFFTLFIQACCHLAFIKLTNYYLLIINVIILGFASYGFNTSNYLYLLQQCENQESKRLQVINLLSTASNLGLGISAIAIGYFSQFGFHYIFLATSFTLFILSYLLYKKGAAYLAINKKPAHSPSINSHLNYIIIFILICVFLIGMIISQLSSTYPIYIKNAFPEFGVNAYSFLFLLNTSIVILFETPIGAFIAKYNSITMVGIGSFLVGLGMMLLNFASSFTLAFLSCGIYTVGEIIFFSMVQLVCYQKSNDNKKGSTLGLYRMVFASSRIAGPFFGGFIYYHYSSSLIWYLSGVIGVVCLVCCLYLNNISSEMNPARIN